MQKSNGFRFFIVGNGKCVCIEREERYCEIGALRMQQEVLPFHATPQPQAVQQEIGIQ